MRRRLLLSMIWRAPGAMLLAPALARAAGMWSLVSPDEVARDRAAPRKPITRGMLPPGAPVIQVERPNTEAQLPRPFSVRVRFVPAPDASIVTSTFKATYGWLGIDITERLLEHATLTADGLTADDVNAPAGEHRVTVSIGDSRGRVGSRTFRFTIA
jgi:hypothetical protein